MNPRAWSKHASKPLPGKVTKQQKQLPKRRNFQKTHTQNTLSCSNGSALEAHIQHQWSNCGESTLRRLLQLIGCHGSKSTADKYHGGWCETQETELQKPSAASTVRLEQQQQTNFPPPHQQLTGPVLSLRIKAVQSLAFINLYVIRNSKELQIYLLFFPLSQTLPMSYSCKPGAWLEAIFSQTWTFSHCRPNAANHWHSWTANCHD